jgi:hypothetical protein
MLMIIAFAAVTVMGAEEDGTAALESIEKLAPSSRPNYWITTNSRGFA